jgi:hypothetical protein
LSARLRNLSSGSNQAFRNRVQGRWTNQSEPDRITLQEIGGGGAEYGEHWDIVFEQQPILEYFEGIVDPMRR